MSRPHSTTASHFRFCPNCSTEMQPAGRDGRSRPVCRSCGFVQYRNPVAGVAAILFESEIVRLLGEEVVRAATGQEVDASRPRVLLGRRAATYRGTFCLPCGYVEFDEDAREAIQRETEEETGLVITPGSVFAVHSNFHDPDKQSVGIWFRAHPVAGTLRPGDDVDALLFVPPSSPGVPLAFPTDAIVLAELAERSGRVG